jgi:hypothetical protein
VPNVVFDAEAVRPSPFSADRLFDPSFLANPNSERFAAAEGVDARDYAWLYLTAHHFDHVVWHRATWAERDNAGATAKIRSLLDEARSFEDPDVIVFDRAKLHPPTHLTWLCGEGFRSSPGRSGPWSFGVLREARLVVYQPDDQRPVVIRLLDARAFASRRVVRLLEADRELARWVVEPGEPRTIESPPLPLNAGIHELRLISDSDSRPGRSADQIDDGRTPYSLRLKSVQVEISHHLHP